MIIREADVIKSLLDLIRLSLPMGVPSEPKATRGGERSEPPERSEGDASEASVRSERSERPRI